MTFPPPPDDDIGRAHDGAPEGEPKPPRPARQAKRWLKWPAAAVATLLLVFIALAGVLYGALHTERGTRYAWQVALHVLDGRLSGALDGGTLENGVRLSNVRWHSGATDIRISRATGQWRLTRAPWRLTVDFLQLGTVDVSLPPSPPSKTRTPLPRKLTLPLQLDLRRLGAQRVVLHNGASSTVLTDISLDAKSDGRHHELALHSLGTPFGEASAGLRLDGERPFKLTGDAGFSGKLAKEAVRVGARLSGSLEALCVDVDASGMKLSGHAHIAATPFGELPFSRVSVSADHINPQSLAPGAPAADLAIRADLAPLQTAAVAGPAALAGPASMANTANTANPAGTTGTAPGLTVSGPVSVVNSKAGALDQHLLPLIDAHAVVTLDAKQQLLDALRIRLVDHATLTGKGRLAAGGDGRFDLQANNLDLHAFYATLRQTALAGPVALTMRDGQQHIDAKLAEAKGGVQAQAAIALTPEATNIERLRLQVGDGRVDLKGVLRKDRQSTYKVDATLVHFDPLSLLAPKAAGAAKTRTGSRAAGMSKTHAGAPASVVRNAGTKAPGRKAGATTAATRNTGMSTAMVQGAGGEAVVARNTQAKSSATGSGSPLTGPPRASVSGTFTASGGLAPEPTTKLVFALKDSVYNGLPLTGGGTLQVAGKRLLPSDVKLSVAGNDVALNGRFGAPGDRLRFDVRAPALDRLGFGVAGTLLANGDLTGSFAHPDVAANYQADALVFGDNRVGHAQGRAELRSGPRGALVASIDASDIEAAGARLATLNARLDGTRAAHTLAATAKGTLHDRPIDMTLAARGKLTDSPAGTRWDGTVTDLSNRGMPALTLGAPVTISASAGRLVLGATRLTVETAVLDLRSLSFDHGKLASAGRVSHIDVNRLLEIAQELGGTPPPVKTDLVFDGDWDFNLADRASGYLQLARRSGDVTASAGRGLAALGIDALRARVDFAAGNEANLTMLASAARIGHLDADLHTGLVARDGVLTVDQSASLRGRIKAEVPSLLNTGALLGPQYILGGHLGLDLTVTGQVGRPEVSGNLAGDGLSATLVDQGVTLTQGIVRIALTQNLVDFQQVEFHGASGTLRATGKVQLDNANPDVTAQIVADKLELFAAPDRQLSLSGSATVANGGPAGGMAIDGKFNVDHALFDLPDSPAPKLGDDVVIVRSDGKLMNGDNSTVTAGTNKPVGRFAPRANVQIDLGKDFRFHGAGADLRLQGLINALSAPNEPLRAVGNVRVLEGSTYEAFGRKLGVENGYFTFNGPVSNPGINILAMRRNQEVEAGVQVTGTVQAPVARLVSEPNVPDGEKLSWLLFGHGTDTGTNLGQQSTMTAALALLGNAGGKRIAQSLGLDEISIGQSDVGLTDPQVVSIAKALNERFVLGYEQGLTTAGSVFKLTWQLTRNWSIALHSGTLNGLDLLFNRRFD